MRRKVFAVCGSVAAIGALAFAGVALSALMAGSGSQAGYQFKLPSASAMKKALRPETKLKINFASRASINRYLRSIGVNPATVVVQRGHRNYAGPSCPGRGWNCTSATRIVQVMDNDEGENKVVCQGPGTSTPPAAGITQNCVAVQGSLTTRGNNKFVCIEHSHDPNASQSCNGTQQTLNGQNVAIVDQVITNTQHGSQQDGRQQMSITQNAVNGKNKLTFNQRIKFVANHGGENNDNDDDDNQGDEDDNGGPPSGPVQQTQDGNQVAVVTQLGGGDSNSAGAQSQDLRAKARSKDGPITQLQNTLRPSPFGDCHPDASTPTAAQVVNPNECALIIQHSNGNRTSNLDQAFRLNAKAYSDGPITQVLSEPDGGGDWGVDQFVASSTGVPIAHHNQHEDFDAIAKSFKGGTPPGPVDQEIHGPFAGNSPSPLSQGPSPDARGEFSQSSDIHASPGPALTLFTPLAVTPFQEEEGNVFEEDDAMGLFWTTTGNAHGVQNMNTDVGNYHADSSGNVLFMDAACVGADPCAGTTVPPTTTTETIG